MTSVYPKSLNMISFPGYGLIFYLYNLFAYRDLPSPHSLEGKLPNFLLFAS